MKPVRLEVNYYLYNYINLYQTNLVQKYMRKKIFETVSVMVWYWVSYHITEED